ncbi:MAG: DUF2284 domain-containing protein [Clostridia bacterium]
MKMTEQEGVALALACGAHHAAALPPEKRVLDAMFRDLCANNACGRYGKCYMCPPDVGDIHALMREIQRYDHAVLFQTIQPLEDSFDFEGMQAASALHHRISRDVRQAASTRCTQGMLCLSSGGCGACEKCAKEENLPCRFPQEAMSSLEGYGVDVYHTAQNAGLSYINGVNTVTYFGMLLFDRRLQA